MKKNILIVTISLLALVISACAPAATSAQPVENAGAPAITQTPPAPVSEPVTAELINTDFEDAANLRSQLAYGTLQLKDTSDAISAEQAKLMLPLWQAIVALSGDDTTASEELTAVQDQILQSLSAGQVAAINGMKITNATLSAYYASLGISMPTPVPGVTKVPGAKKDMSEADKQATRTAAEAAGLTAGSGQASKTILYEKVIEYLIGLAN